MPIAFKQSQLKAFTQSTLFARGKASRLPFTHLQWILNSVPNHTNDQRPFGMNSFPFLPAGYVDPPPPSGPIGAIYSVDWSTVPTFGAFPNASEVNYYYVPSDPLQREDSQANFYYYTQYPQQNQGIWDYRTAFPYVQWYFAGIGLATGWVWEQQLYATEGSPDGKPYLWDNRTFAQRFRGRSTFDIFGFMVKAQIWRTWGDFNGQDLPSLPGISYPANAQTVRFQNFKLIRQQPNNQELFHLPAMSWIEPPMPLSETNGNYADGFLGHISFLVINETPAQWMARTGLFIDVT